MSNTTAPANMISAESLDQLFLVIMGSLVFFMQAGFACLEAGCVSAKNVSNILFKNLMDVVIGAIAYFAVGFAFSYGTREGNDFIGTEFFALVDLPDSRLAEYFFQYTFAATATTIVSGAMAGRTSVIGYVTYSILVTGVIYPVVVYWTWSSNAWLTAGKDGSGFNDFAGSAIVHCTGGTAALVGAILLGPRKERMKSPTFEPITAHSTPLATLGAFILVFGFFAFNGGSVLAITGDGNGEQVALAMVNTIMAASGGGMVACLIEKKVSGDLNLMRVINGVIAGMVAVCAGAGSVRPWAGFVIGCIGGLSFYVWSRMLQKFKIDDAIDAVGVHLGAGLWGILAQPLFEYETGVFYGSTEQNFKDFAWNIAGAITIITWVAGTSFVMFYPLKKMGLLRVSEEVEKNGLDVSEHGGAAYTMKPDAAKASGMIGSFSSIKTDVL